MVKLGGHLIPSPPTPPVISSYTKTFQRIRALGHKLIVVVGGGNLAREYIAVARKLGASEFTCDLIGIEVSRLNAMLLIAKLGDAVYTEPVTSLSNLIKAYETNKIVVLGGLQPGQSTNAVGILAAEAVNADLFINATDIDGVYSANPAKDPNAIKLDIIKTDKLLKMLLANQLFAGSYPLFDPVAIKIVERSNIPTRIINGKVPANIESVVMGREIGTRIVSALKETEK